MASTNALPTLHEIRIRAYNELTDLQRADEMEKICEAGPGGKVSLFTDLLGDPLGRIRHYPAFAMLVAETEPEREIVGLIRAGVKEVVCGAGESTQAKNWKEGNAGEEGLEKPAFARIAYILGLRISPRYRRLGIGEQMVRKMEEWCRERGAEYVYIATEKENEASLNLFTKKLSYGKFRTPSILVQPVYERSKKLRKTKVQVEKMSSEEAQKLYDRVMKETEFFVSDIATILTSRLNKGTWRAKWKNRNSGHVEEDSWAVISVWKCNEIYSLQLSGASLRMRALAAASRAVGRLLGLPSVPDVFRPFGVQLIYGLHAEGPHGAKVLRELCWAAHNLARRDRCAVVAVEVASCDPLRGAIPHWKAFSCDEDLWCIKRLSHQPSDSDSSSSSCWTTRPPAPSLFVDPRDF